VIFIVANSTQGLLDTVLSRCQIIRLASRSSADGESAEFKKIDSLALLSQYAQTQEDVEKLMLSLRHSIVTTPNASQSQEMFNVLKKLHIRYQYIVENNFNISLTLDTL
jgi:hypothetical protein